MTFSLQNVTDVIEKVDSCVESLVKSGRGKAIRNERYLHHMFSHFLASLDSNAWANIAICPEEPTRWKFSSKKIRLDDPAFTRNEAIGKGQDGNFDFMLRNSPSIAVEWKGPKNCSVKDWAEALIKLLSRPTEEPIVLAAILITKSGKRNHALKLQQKLKRALEFACEVLEINDVTDRKMYAFVRSHFDTGAHEISWGEITSVASAFE